MTQKRPRAPKEHKTLENVSADGDSKFARALGSSEFHTRERGLEALTRWLSARGAELEEFDLLKLWKGVFYCFWHSDKLPVQTSLADRLSEIMTLVPEQVGVLYYQTFMRTMRREWLGIDRLRLDKFMMLLRKFLASLLRMLQGNAWQPAQLSTFARFWQAEVLCPGDSLAAAGVAYHLADTLLPELIKLAAEGAGPPADAAALAALLDPFALALAQADGPAMVYRLQQGLWTPLVEEVRSPSEGAPLAALDVPTLAARLFDLGARPETKARSREALYGISTALEKAAKQAAKAGSGSSAPAGAAEQQQRATPAAAPAAAAAGGVAAKQQQQQQQEQQEARGNKKKRKSAEGAGEPAPAVAAAPPAAAAAAATPGKRAKAAAVVAAEAAEAAPETVGKSAKKKKKALQQLTPPAAAQLQAAAAQEQQQQQAPTPAAAPPSTQQRKQQQQHGRGQDSVAAGAKHTPGAGAAPGSSPSKKAVKFQLRRNLVNVIGQPPKPADVRTPPTSRPKGPALKKHSALPGLDLYQSHSAPGRLTRGGASRLEAGANPHRLANGHGAEAPREGSASASKAEQRRRGGGAAAGTPGLQKRKQQQQQHGGAGPRRLSLKSPGSLPRPRASEFF